MTVQLSDILVYQASSFRLAGCAPSEPFDPFAYGYQPVMASTACRRGYRCEYTVEDGRLRLDRLWINHQVDGEHSRLADLNAVKAIPSQQRHLGGWVFAGLKLPMSYTGELMIAQGLVNTSMTQQGYYQPWQYSEVYALSFATGTLISVDDLSTHMAEKRAHYTQTNPSADE